MSSRTVVIIVDKYHNLMLKVTVDMKIKKLDMYMKEIGQEVFHLEKEDNNIVMEIFMKAIKHMDKNLVKVLIVLMMEGSIRDIFI